MTLPVFTRVHDKSVARAIDNRLATLLLDVNDTFAYIAKLINCALAGNTQSRLGLEHPGFDIVAIDVLHPGSAVGRLQSVVQALIGYAFLRQDSICLWISIETLFHRSWIERKLNLTES